MPQTTSLREDKYLPNSSSTHRILFILLITATVLAVFWKLGGASLAAWDEAIYAEVSKETARGGGWLTLHWAGKPWFEKPPLFVWMTALLFRWFGVSEFWARVVSALSGVCLVALTYAIGKLSFDRMTGLLAGLVLLTGYHFLSFARFGTMEVMLTLFVYLAVYAYQRVRLGEGKFWLVVWIACALALMTKGAGGLVAPAVIALALIFDGRAGVALQDKHFRLGCVLFVLLVAPWHVAMLAWHGRVFLNEYLGYHVFARATRTLEGNPSSYFYYLARLIDGFFPWCLIAPFAIASSIRENLKAETRTKVFLLLILLVFGAYTLIPTRRPWYIIPLYPALAILIAAFISKLYRAHQARPVYRRGIIAASALLILVAGAYSALSLYLNSKGKEPVAQLASAARSESLADKDSLIAFSEAEPFYAQTLLFYSDRTVEQAYASFKPASTDAPRYVTYENLSDITGASVKRIILRQSDIARLSAVGYEIHVMAQADSLVYATIRRNLK